MVVQLLSLAEVRLWLERNGVPDAKRAGVTSVQDVVDGIDADQPMYLRWFFEGEKLVQYRDRASVAYPSGNLGGQWFALPSHDGRDLGSLGIGSGHAGKHRVELTVARPFEALETTAKSMLTPGKPPYERYTGPGGATQVFIPDRGLSALR